MPPRARRFLFHWSLASALALGAAAFAYSPYAFPGTIRGDALALAFEMRSLFLRATLWTLGPAASLPELGAKLVLTIVLLCALVPALLGLLLPAARRS